jgi:hypothetical protein
MATNIYFRKSRDAARKLLENLTAEAIRAHGIDTYYVPRKLNSYDDVFGEDTQSTYEQAYAVEMWLKSYDGFRGNGDFLSKFNVEIRDQVVFSVARKSFKEHVADYTSQLRPNEGDLIYYPLNKKLFQVTYVNNFEVHYQLESLTTWELTCELFEYSNETFSTGIEEIDRIQPKFSTDVYDWGLMTEDGDYLLTERGDVITLEQSSVDDLLPGDVSDEIQAESDTFVNFNETDPFSEGNT